MSLLILEKEVISLNQQQLRDGYRSDGTRTKRYEEKTKKRKKAEGRILTGDWVSLVDTRAFWDSFFFDADKDKLIFGATDGKADMLLEEWGPSILGLTDANLKILANKLRPVLAKNLKDFINNG